MLTCWAIGSVLCLCVAACRPKFLANTTQVALVNPTEYLVMMERKVFLLEYFLDKNMFFLPVPSTGISYSSILFIIYASG